jgi:hypothetical protein
MNPLGSTITRINPLSTCWCRRARSAGRALISTTLSATTAGTGLVGGNGERHERKAFRPSAAARFESPLLRCHDEFRCVLWAASLRRIVSQELRIPSVPIPAARAQYADTGEPALVLRFPARGDPDDGQRRVGIAPARALLARMAQGWAASRPRNSHKMATSRESCESRGTRVGGL